MNQENKQSEPEKENKFSIWTDGSLDEIQYVKFSEEKNQTIHVKFLENEPSARVNKFNQKAFDFEVFDLDSEEIKTLSVTSMRLMRKLEPNIPLEGKSFTIQREGSEMDTSYNVETMKVQSEVS